MLDLAKRKGSTKITEAQRLRGNSQVSLTSFHCSKSLLKYLLSEFLGTCGLSSIYMYRHGIHVLPQGALEWFKSEFGSGAGSPAQLPLVDLCDPACLAATSNRGCLVSGAHTSTTIQGSLTRATTSATTAIFKDFAVYLVVIILGTFVLTSYLPVAFAVILPDETYYLEGMHQPPTNAGACRCRSIGGTCRQVGIQAILPTH